MKYQINEIKRLQELAGILNEEFTNFSINEGGSKRSKILTPILEKITKLYKLPGNT